MRLCSPRRAVMLIFAAAPLLFATGAASGQARIANYALSVVPDYSLPSRPDVVARWDPCTQIRWAINTAGAPRGARTEVQRVLEEISASTGLQFVYAGRTVSRASTTPSGALDAASVAASGADLVVQWEQRGSATGLLAHSPGLAGVGTAAVSGGYPVVSRGVISRDRPASALPRWLWMSRRAPPRCGGGGRGPAPGCTSCCCTSSATRSAWSTPRTPAR